MQSDPCINPFLVFFFPSASVSALGSFLWISLLWLLYVVSNGPPLDLWYAWMNDKCCCVIHISNPKYPFITLPAIAFLRDVVDFARILVLCKFPCICRYFLKLFRLKSLKMDVMEESDWLEFWRFSLHYHTHTKIHRKNIYKQQNYFSISKLLAILPHNEALISSNYEKLTYNNPSSSVLITQALKPRSDGCSPLSPPSFFLGQIKHRKYSQVLVR